MEQNNLFFDTEFSEGFVKPISWLPYWFPFNKPKWTVELISIGIVKENGDTYYAVSSEFSRSNCNKWVKENVLPLLPEKMLIGDDEYWDGDFGTSNLIPNPVYKSLNQIKKDVIKFAGTHPVFYAYFADYDWVVLCSNIFGSMINLPKGWPMYCRDLKQVLDDKANDLTQIHLTSHIFDAANKENWELMSGASISKDIINIDDYSIDMKIELLKVNKGYPKNQKAHDALDDAKWNLNLYSFLHTLKQS